MFEKKIEHQNIWNPRFEQADYYKCKHKMFTCVVTKRAPLKTIWLVKMAVYTIMSDQLIWEIQWGSWSVYKKHERN